MKKFIIKITLFCTVPIIIYVAFFYVLKWTIIENISKHQIIILGDSQTEFILNDDIYNHSVNGSPYFVHYKFAKEFITQLKGKKIYIAYNYHNLSKLYQNRLANNTLLEGWRTSVFKQLDEYHIFNYKHSEIRPKDLDYTFFDFKKLPELYSKIYPESNKNTNSINNIKDDTLSILKAIQRHWHHKDYVLEDSTQKLYLTKLIDLLNKNNCEVVLLKMPLTDYYFKNVPIKIKNDLLKLAVKSNSRMLDLNNELSISKKYKYFKDYGHLNKLGDSIIMDYFIKNELETH